MWVCIAHELRGIVARSVEFCVNTAAFDQLSKATKQVVSFADASVRAATANATATSKTTTKGRKAA